MSHQIVECPGCLTKLRVRESNETITLQCPRCGEQLAVDPPDVPNDSAPIRKAPSPKKNPAGQSPTSRPAPKPAPAKPRPRPTPAEEPEFAASWDEPSRPAAAAPNSPKPSGGNGLQTAMIAGGAVAIVGVLILGVVMMMNGGDKPTVTEAIPSGGLSPVTTPTPGMTSGTNQPVTPGSTAPVVPSGIGSSVPPAVVGTQPPLPVTPPGSTLPALPNPLQGNQVALSGENRKLRYHWKPGAEFIYQFSIDTGSNDQGSRASGTCSYTVQGDSTQIVADEESSGTGFVVTPDGYIATCAHVVEGAKRLEVHLGGQAFPATVVAVDGRTDVAIVRINANGLNPLVLTDSEGVQLAESVRAIGFPLSDVLGTDVKVTTGTVAGIVQDKQRGKRIQVDAPINPGNSGGPVVNGAGQVIGVASAKLSGASVTAVGFASPVNHLRSLAATKGIQLPVAARGGDLAGPEVARRVTPSVAYIKVWGNSGGRMYTVNFNANFSETEKVNMRGGFPRPSFPQMNADRGQLTVNALGEVAEFQGEQQLPAVLGPVGVFFMEPLDAYSENQWMVEKESTLQRIQEDEGPFGGMGPRFGPRFRGFGGPGGFGPPGFGPPGFGQPQEKVVEEIPAIERVSYQVGQSLNDRISIQKGYEFTATRSNGQPYMVIRGNGTLVFDLTQGMPFSLDYQGTIEQTDEDGTSRIPVRVTYQLRNPEEVKKEREAAMAKMEADRKQQEEERSQPKPELVEELLAEVRKAEGGSQASGPLGRLAQIAVVEDRRDDVLRVARNHIKNSNPFVRKCAAEVLCQWATANEKDDLLKILSDSDGLMHDAKRKAIRTLAKIGTEKDYPTIIMSITDSAVRSEVKDALISIGVAAEPAILETYDRVSDGFAKNELLEVLKKIGTEKSIPMLEKLATSNDFSVKHNAQQALDGVRSRL